MKTLIWGHRGSRFAAPENTLESFSLAIAQKADGIELDVHLSADGEIVVTHDETLERCSNGAGRVISKTLAELKTLDFSKPVPSFSPVRIPTLREVYDLMRPTGLTINVEVKSGLVVYPGIERKLIELAREMNMEDRLLYSSFNHYSLMLLREIDPAVRIGLLYQEALIDPFLYAQHIKANAIHPMYPTLAVPGVIEGCKKAGVAIHPWTVNDPQAIRRLVQAGVDAVITDIPDQARKIVEEAPPYEA